MKHPNKTILSDSYEYANCVFFTLLYLQAYMCNKLRELCRSAKNRSAAGLPVYALVEYMQMATSAWAGYPAIPVVDGWLYNSWHTPP